MMLTSCVLLSLLTAVSGLIVCLEGELGCFSSSPPNTGGPQRQFEYITNPTDVNFFLYNQENIDHPQEISFHDPSALASSCFHPGKKTYFIIHNFIQDSKEPRLVEVTKAILKMENANVFMVDWSRGSIVAYGQVMQTAQLVGKMVAVFITHLETLHKYPPCKITLIGCCVGGHIAGIVGNLHPGIWKIVALDAAGYGFEDRNEQNRLNPHSAELVINLHTNGRPFSQGGFGCVKPLARIDVYVNGGENMPECPQSVPGLSPEQIGCILSTVGGQLECPNPLPSAQDCANITAHLTFTRKLVQSFFRMVACSHFQAIYYYIHSILHPRGLCGRPCSTLQNCHQGVTEQRACVDVGHYAQPCTCGMFYAELELDPISPIWNTTETF